MGKSNVLGLGGVLEAFYISTTLKEVGFFPTLVYFYLWAVMGLFGLLWPVLWLLRGCLASFMVGLRGRLAGFTS